MPSSNFRLSDWGDRWLWKDSRTTSRAAQPGWWMFRVYCILYINLAGHPHGIPFFVGGHHHGIHRTTHTIHTSLVNFHLGWFAQKTPHKSPKNCVFPLFYERFWDLWVFFLGTNPSGKLVHFLDFCIYFHHTYTYIRYIQCIHRGGRLFAQKAAFRNEDCHLEMVTFFQRFACCEVIVDGAGRMPGWSRTVGLGVGLRDAWMVSPMGCQDGVPKK